MRFILFSNFIYMSKKQTTNTEIDLGNAKDQIKRAASQVKDIAGKLKQAYANLDPQAKKKVMAGIAGVAALLAGVAMVKKGKKKGASK